MRVRVPYQPLYPFQPTQDAEYNDPIHLTPWHLEEQIFDPNPQSKIRKVTDKVHQDQSTHASPAGLYRIAYCFAIRQPYTAYIPVTSTIYKYIGVPNDTYSYMPLQPLHT